MVCRNEAPALVHKFPESGYLEGASTRPFFFVFQPAKGLTFSPDASSDSRRPKPPTPPRTPAVIRASAQSTRWVRGAGIPAATY